MVSIQGINMLMVNCYFCSWFVSLSTVELRINFKIVCLTFKALNGLALKYLTDQINHFESTRSLRSAEKELLVILKIRTKTFGTRAFSFAAPTLYNTLPYAIKQSTTLTTFESPLKPTFSLLPISCKNDSIDMLIVLIYHQLCVFLSFSHL